MLKKIGGKILTFKKQIFVITLIFIIFLTFTFEVVFFHTFGNKEKIFASKIVKDNKLNQNDNSPIWNFTANYSCVAISDNGEFIMVGGCRRLRVVTVPGTGPEVINPSEGFGPVPEAGPARFPDGNPLPGRHRQSETLSGACSNW